MFSLLHAATFITQQLLEGRFLLDEAPSSFDGLSRWNFNTLCRVLFLAQFQ